MQTGCIVVPDADTCYRVVQGRDARFDGWFFIAVRTTGIYCRPSCPAVTPQRKKRAFFPSSAAAQRAGYRAFRRCRPDASPGSPDWDVRGDLAGRALRLIRDGEVDRSGVPGLARRLGYSDRQIHRTLMAEVGAGPLALARAQRAQTARILLETTDVPATDVAFAAGFASVRQFNEQSARSSPRRPVDCGRTGGLTVRPLLASSSYGCRSASRWIWRRRWISLPRGRFRASSRTWTGSTGGPCGLPAGQPSDRGQPGGGAYLRCRVRLDRPA